MMRIDRARQFMPFSALNGYDKVVKSKEKIAVKKKEITEEIAIKLSFTISAIKKGDMVKIVYYDGESECYVAKTGVVTKIETEERKITVVKTVIYFDDIYDLARI